MFDDATGCDRANAFDQTGAEIFLYAGDGRRARHSVFNRFELIAVLRMLRPPSRQPQALTRRDRRKIADNRDRLAVTGDLKTKHCVSVPLIVIGHSLNRAGDDLMALRV